MSFDVNETHPAADTSSQPDAAVPTQENIQAQEAGAKEEDNTFEALLAAYEGRTQSFSEGEVIKGRVIAISGTGVIVDVGFKSEGIIPIEQFMDDRGQVTIKAGDTVDVFLEQTEDHHGYVVLSREKAERMKIWDEIERAYREGTVVKGRVIERIKGGLAVDIGVRAFLPGSQIDLRPVRNLDSLRGEEFEMRVIKVNKKRGNIVLSRKAVLEESMKEEKAKTMEVLEDGKVMEGVVKNITDYGAFIDLGGVDGLLHITDMSWGRVNHPSELFSVGDKLKVKVIKFRPRRRPRLAGLQAADRRSLAACGHALSEKHARSGQSRQPDRLRRICGTGARHRGTDSHFRDDLEQTRKAPVENRHRRGYGGSLSSWISM